MTDRIDLGLTDINSGCGCCASPVAVTATVAATGAVTEEILVAGMTCAHCVSRVTEKLTGIEGVQNVAVDLHAGGASRVTVYSATPLSADAMSAAVKDAGYGMADTPA
ncbi:heavy-metal-associated domain-containing protein [Microbacterium sp. CJ88]|uniref:heavy-metal-associated domain-containing protein n=1 Tax=Microbacterium sp. CJ88 TaxID=3445672 RepID=UPI003F65987D